MSTTGGPAAPGPSRASVDAGPTPAATRRRYVTHEPTMSGVSGGMASSPTGRRGAGPVAAVGARGSTGTTGAPGPAPERAGPRTARGGPPRAAATPPPPPPEDRAPRPPDLPPPP